MKENPTLQQKSAAFESEGAEQESEGKSAAPPTFQLMAGDDNPVQRKGSDGGMPNDLVNGFAASTGHDLSNVNVHYNSDKPAQVGALAYAQGNDIHLGAGQEKHLAHEAAHVVQQRENRVKPTTEVAGKPVNDSKSLESEADSMGAKAAQMKTAPAAEAKQSAANGPAQRMEAPIQRVLSFADAKKQIEKAVSFWGNDKGAMYGAIEQVSAADRLKLKTDPDVQKILKKELSGHDYWKAQLLLEFGSEAAFPNAIKEIWAATKGWGTDERRVYQAIQNLPAADVAAIKNVPGLQDILKDEMSGNDLTAATDLLDGKWHAAIQNHKDNVAFAKNEINQMRATGTQQEKNTAEWVEPTTAGAKAKNEVYILTKTHDSALRATHHGAKNSEAYFGDSPVYPSDAATYDPEIGSKRNIHISESNVRGEHNGIKIWLMEPKAMGGPDFRYVLIHEVQHDADRHDKELGYEQSFAHPEESWNRYKTEFRAYWVDGERSWRSDVAGSEPAPWDNRRQKAIFDHLYGGYKWLKPHYDNKSLVYGTPFDELVHKYTRPEGVNLGNSPTIDNFFIALEKCKISDTDLTKSPLKDLETAANALSASDRTAMNQNDAKRLQEMMKDNLEASNILPHFAKLVNGGALPAWMNVNIAEERKAITDAVSGWGTDKTKIFDTLSKASVAELVEMKRDPHIRKAIYGNLSGDDLWKALFMLEWGAEAAWPNAVKELYAACKGWGTDEARIRKALQGLTRPQVEAIAKVEGIRAMLNDELSGQDKTTTDELLSGAYADAIKAREDDMAAIDAVIQAGLAGADAAWKALCQKLVDPSQATLYAMTATHDSAKRAAEAKQGAKTAYFGSNAAYPTRSTTYDSQLSATKDIRFVAGGTQQETVGRVLYVYAAKGIGAGPLKTLLETFAKTLP